MIFIFSFFLENEAGVKDYQKILNEFIKVISNTRLVMLEPGE